MLGSALSQALTLRGDQVIALVRREAQHAAEISWDPAAGVLDPAALTGIDAVVNLSGAPLIQIPRRWTRSYIEELYASRIGPTRTLAAAIASVDEPPKVLISQSGAGYYGSHESSVYDESGPQGEGVLADLCGLWEAATAQASDVTRVTRMRTGVVLGPRGGALAKLLVPLKWGVGGNLGSGEQYWPWISQPDLVAAIVFLLDQRLDGAVNLVAPELGTVAQLVEELARALHRPHFFSVPAPLLELGLSKAAAREVLLTSTKTRPAVLLEQGFNFQHPELRSASEWVVSQL